MLTTNVNDYAIQPNGLHGLKAKRQHRIQVQEVPLKFKQANMTMPASGLSLSPGHPLADRHREMAKPHGQGWHSELLISPPFPCLIFIQNILCY